MAQRFGFALQRRFHFRVRLANFVAEGFGLIEDARPQIPLRAGKLLFELGKLLLQALGGVAGFARQFFQGVRAL